MTDLVYISWAAMAIGAVTRYASLLWLVVCCFCLALFFSANLTVQFFSQKVGTYVGYLVYTKAIQP